MFSEAFEKAGINGIAAAAVATLYYGKNVNVINPLGNGQMPLYVLAGSVAVLGSIAGDVAHLFMKEAVPISKKSSDRTSLITGAAANGLLFGAFLYAYQPEILDDFGILEACLLGAGAELAGASGYSYLKETEWL
jgi:hypothetical protein